MRGVATRQRVGIEDRIAREIRNRHFGGRNQEQFLLARRRLEKVRLEFRQLPGADQCMSRHEIRRINFRVSVLARMQVEHVLDQRAMQTRDAGLEHHEARAGNPAGRLEIDQRQFLADRHVVDRREIELPRRAPATHFNVGRFVAALGHAFVQHVRQAEHQFIELRLHRGEFLVEGGKLATERFALREQRRDVLPLRLRLADVLRDAHCALHALRPTRPGRPCGAPRWRAVAPGRAGSRDAQGWRPRPRGRIEADEDRA